MIDRQRLFEFFAQEHGLTLLESQMNDIINEVGACQDSWVKCSDRLPEDGTHGVIAYIADRGTVIVCSYVGDFSLARVSSENGFEHHGVTHWMPLPDPPKEG